MSPCSKKCLVEIVDVKRNLQIQLIHQAANKQVKPVQAYNVYHVK